MSCNANHLEGQRVSERQEGSSLVVAASTIGKFAISLQRNEFHLYNKLLSLVYDCMNVWLQTQHS